MLVRYYFGDLSEEENIFLKILHIIFSSFSFSHTFFFVCFCFLYFWYHLKNVINQYKFKKTETNLAF